MRKLTPTDYLLMPWKNGAGTTTEIHREPPAPEAWTWRVSIAAVTADGPFSLFPGCERHIMALDGEGFELSGVPVGPLRVASHFHPVSFSGDWPVSARLLGGPTRDFNLIADRSRVKSSLTSEPLIAPRRFEAGSATLLIHALQGAAEFAPDRLEHNEGLLLAPGESATLAPLPGPPPRLAICRVEPLP